MMKKNFVKRIGTFLLVVLMVCASSISAFAAEAADSTSIRGHEVTSLVNDVAPRAPIGTGDSGYIAAKGELTLHPTLNSYVGTKRTLWFWASAIYNDNTPPGRIRVYVFKPNGKLLEYFETTANVDNIKTYTLPSSGTYTVEIHSEVNAKLLCNAVWSTATS